MLCPREREKSARVRECSGVPKGYVLRKHRSTFSLQLNSVVAYDLHLLFVLCRHVTRAAHRPSGAVADHEQLKMSSTGESAEGSRSLRTRTLGLVPGAASGRAGPQPGTCMSTTAGDGVFLFWEGGGQAARGFFLCKSPCHLHAVVLRGSMMQRLLNSAFSGIPHPFPV